MSLNTPQQTLAALIESGVKKAHLPVHKMLILGFVAGALVGMAYLLSIRVSTVIPEQWASLATLLGAAVFPVGLVLIILAGGELLTGNLMSVFLARLARRITLRHLIRNWLIVGLSNALGAMFVAYAFGYVVGLSEGIYLEHTLHAAHGKVEPTFVPTFVSAIGCNWLVCLAVWMSYVARDMTGKILGIWFPIMAFAAIGFQHVVANMFLLSAALFAGDLSVGQVLANLSSVLLGNAVGGIVFVGLAFYVSYASPNKGSTRGQRVNVLALEPGSPAKPGPQRATSN